MNKENPLEKHSLLVKASLSLPQHLKYEVDDDEE